MKIVYVAPLPERVGGGGNKVAYDLAREMSKLHDVVIIFPSEDGKERFYSEDGLKKYGIKSAWQGDLYTPVLSVKVLNKLEHFLEKLNPDIVHAHSSFFLEQVVQNWCIDNNTPYFYTTHFMPSQIHTWFDLETLKQLGPKLFDNRIAKNYMKSFYEKCSAIITLNKESSEDLLQFGYTGQSFIIRNGHNLSLFDTLPLSSIKEKSIKLLYVGSISQRKNQDYLIKVMEYLPARYKLSIVGNTQDPNYLNRIEAHIKERKLKNVEILGKVPFEKLPQIYADCHLFLSASKNEVQSLAVVEALIAGKPVVCLENQTTRELINDSNGILLGQDTRPEIFAKKIESLISDGDSKYYKMAEYARNSVQQFGYNSVIKETVDAYQSVIGEKRGQGGKISRKLIVAGIVFGTVGMYAAFKTARVFSNKVKV